ncbi:MAG TPA: hypothetical protein VG938_10670 [Verrucomicrobiae bacterium]|jgi:hypothetical protein|nr:hypothetical protein [Verrucomicrobiae bacterium]
MKTLRPILLGAVALAIIGMMNRRSNAQATNAAENRGSFGKYEQLLLYLSKRGDSNTIEQVHSFVIASDMEHNAGDIAMNVRILRDLRSGKTNEAIDLLETQLDGDLVTFAYPDSLKHDSKYDKFLRQAKEYRTKYPHKSGNAEIDATIARAFDTISK